ncbi:unnamed protein product [Prorocentrum cordatum]|uniref:Letm1 RBD domain-containing protein n=1 Tax=Prorocentrum cordatum TaxID=2364126 RepID=A0ABN9UXE6_9DINO|nr:unnamed protein product [Polarella glacialis]
MTRRQAASADDGAAAPGGAAPAGAAHPQADVGTTPGEAVGSGARPAQPSKFLLYLREDQTVDIDAALKESRDMTNMSTDLAARLRGKGHDHEDPLGGSRTPPLSKALQERVSRRQTAMTNATNGLELARARRESVIGAIREPKSGVVSLDPESYARLTEQLSSADREIRGWGTLVLQANIELLFEQAATALESRLERAAIADWDDVGRELKAQVFELAMLDQAVRSQRLSDLDVEAAAACGLDQDELRMVEAHVARFARRLGIRANIVGHQRGLFRPLAHQWSSFTGGLPKARRAASFCARGVGLLCQDLQQAAKLALKVVFLKYTLEPREAKLCYRAVKDVFVLVPFLIILLIPISPPGHVLVFSFIMKVYPDFFPSPFTERRQSAMRIYNAIKPPARD